jgi:hypothetical protein
VQRAGCRSGARRHSWQNDKTVIEVQPANPQVIYVPQYNPQVVYTTPAPSPPPATAAPASTEGTVSTGTAVAGGLVAFGVGMLIGSAIHNDDCRHAQHHPHVQVHGALRAEVHRVRQLRQPAAGGRRRDDRLRHHHFDLVRVRAGHPLTPRYLIVYPLPSMQAEKALL